MSHTHNSAPPERAPSPEWAREGDRAHRRRPAGRGDRLGGGRVHRARRGARSSWRSTTSGCRARPARSSPGRCARPPGAASPCACSTTSTPSRPARDPPAAGDPARAPARAADRRSRGARDPRPDAPQVRGPRRRRGLDRVRELDDRLVDAAGERLSSRSTRRALAAAYVANFEELWERRDVERSGRIEPGRRSSSRAGWTRARGSRPGTARTSRRRSRRAIAARGGGCGSPRP